MVIKSGKPLFNHPQGTYDDKFWALAVYAAEQAPQPLSRPIARIIMRAHHRLKVTSV